MFVPLCVMGCSSPNRLYLQRPTTGEILGPLSLATQEKIEIAGEKYLVVHPTAQELAVQRILSDTIIPVIDFRGGHSTSDAFAFLWRHVPPGLTYSLDLRGYVRWSSSGPSEPDPFEDTPTVEIKGCERVPVERFRRMVPVPSFSARNIPLIEAVKILCERSHLDFQIEGGVVKVKPKCVQQSPGV